MIPERNPYNNWQGNGLNTNFDFDFYIEDETQLAVYHTNTQGVQTLLVHGRDYSINELKNENGSFITFPLENSEYGILQEEEIISLCLTLPISQENPYGKSDYLDLKTLEYSLDYLTRICQIINRQMERSVKTQEGSSQSADELIEALQQAQVNATNSASAAADSAAAANNSAIAAGEEATIATQQAAEVQATYSEAMSAIATAQTDAVGAVETAQGIAEGAIIAGRENIASDLSNATQTMQTTKTNLINAIQALGIYMVGDRLFYKDSNGVEHEFRNDFGGIAPMPVKHKEVIEVENGFLLKWTEPDDSVYKDNLYCEWGNTVIVRKEGSYPESPFDGVIVVDNTVRNQYAVEGYLDEVDTTRDYKYRAFPRSINRVYSQSDLNKFGFWHYGFSELNTEADPSKRISYHGDNEYFEPCRMDFTNDIFRYGDWENSPFFNWDYIRPCMVYNEEAVDGEGNSLSGQVMEWLDPNDHSKTIDGQPSHVADPNCKANAMVWKKRIFSKRSKGYITTVDFSNVKLDDDYECYPCKRADGTYTDYYFTPMYHGTLINNKLRSLSGYGAMSGKTAQQEIDYARANGTTHAYWDTEVFADIALEEDIFKLVFKNTDSQTVLGNGVTNSSNALSSSGVSGRANQKGQNYGTAGTDFPVKFRYRDNYFAYQWQRCRGIMVVNGVTKVKMTRSTIDGSTVNDYNIDGTGFIALSNVPACSGTSGGYQSGFVSTKYATFSTVVSGSSSTYTCDGRWFNNSGVMYPFRGGGSYYGLLCGAFCWSSNFASSHAYWDIGASLSCKPL